MNAKLILWSYKSQILIKDLFISCQLLLIKSGRYKKIARVETLCPLYNRSEIGDEFQYLLKCTHSSLSDVRGMF